jgi:hypothetical protein
MSGEHFVEHAAETEKVRPRVDAVSSDLFWGHVPRSAEHHSGAGPGAGGRNRFVHQPVRRVGLRPFDELGNAKVEQLDVPVPGDEDVLGLQVAVGNALLVRSGESLRYLDGPLQGGGQRNGPFRQALAQRLALEQLGDEVGLSILKPDVVEGHHVGVVEGAGQPSLALKALEQRRVAAEGFGHDFERDVPLQARVAGSVDFGHSAGAHQRDDLVGANPCARLKTHRAGRLAQRSGTRADNTAARAGPVERRGGRGLQCPS